jgi:uncharacterized protein YdaU (DUF1376 family)
VNFYKHYIGDYQRDTGHLSVTEHGAFRLMLDVYYATEKPLPADRKALYRLLRAESAADRAAIDSVATQFWIQTPAGLINQRADLEIAKAEKQAETNRQIALDREAKKRAKSEREAAEKLAREEHEQSTNRGTGRPTIGQPNHNHSHSHSQTVNLNPPSQGEDSLKPLSIHRGAA